MKISYLITVCDEADELNKLLEHLEPLIDDNDEIVILTDENRVTNEVNEVIKWNVCKNIFHYKSVLNNDFASFKNSGLAKCTGDFVMQIDADEIPHENIIKTLKSILYSNQEVDVYGVPRENYVSNITPAHINKWGWVLDQQNRINYPDTQYRIFRNNGKIKWVKPVHEILDGYNSISVFPYSTEYSLNHTKDIHRQEAQNDLYSKI